jgi:hypothetical protein
MTETATAALFRALRSQLMASGQLWGARVYANLAPAGKKTYPYVIYSHVAGGERNRIKARDAELVLLVKVISDSLAEALSAAAQVEALLNDQGNQDAASHPLVPGSSSEWSVLTATAEVAVIYQEMFANAQPVYHVGSQYRFVMEAT